MVEKDPETQGEVPKSQITKNFMLSVDVDRQQNSFYKCVFFALRKQRKSSQSSMKLGRRSCDAPRPSAWTGLSNTTALLCFIAFNPFLPK